MNEYSSKYNPFNSMKAMKHVNYWRCIKEGIVPPPIHVSIDPCGACNYNCPHCNAAKSFDRDGVTASLSEADIDGIVDMLTDWNTKAVCIGGGGEALCNRHTGKLIKALYADGIPCGIVTNGMYIDHFVDELALCKWVGVSMDAGYADVYAQMKGVAPSAFCKVVENINLLRARAPRLEISWKFLIHPNNVKDIIAATRLSKASGCNLIHFRPGSDPWFAADRGAFSMTEQDVCAAQDDIEDARSRWEDKDFKVYGILHKFNADFTVKRSFKRCWAALTTCYISPEGNIGLCCDRRGDSGVILGHYKDYKKLWGSKKHLDMVAAFDVGKCPRCTYCHVNEIFENVICEDRMMCDFY